MGYEYLGNWEEKTRNQPIEEDLLLAFLTSKQGYSETLSRKAIDEPDKAATDRTKSTEL